MRDGWMETTIGEITELVPGKYIPKSDYVENGQFFIYGSNSVMGKYSHSLIHGPHTVMAAIGAYAGAVRYSPEPSWVNNNAFGLITNSEIQPKYLFLWLATNLDLATVVAGTGQPYVQRPMLQSTSITMPPLAEQKRIVDLVSSVDAYINALQQYEDTTRTARNAILHELLSAGGDDWTESTLGEIITLEYGKPLKAENRDGKGFPVFGSAGEVGLHSKPLVNEAPVIVVGRKGTAGAVWWSDLPCSVIDTAFYVKQKVETNTRFLYFILGYLDLPSLTAQTGVPGLNRDRAYSSQVLLPPLDLQERIVEIVSCMDDVIQGTEQAVMYAKALRSGLLSDLLSGEHEIPASYDSLLGAA
jgi:type I restriction enzyme S subunit